MFNRLPKSRVVHESSIFNLQKKPELMTHVDYTGAKVTNLTMTSADGRDRRIMNGKVSFQKLRRVMLASLSLSDLLEHFNAFESPPNDGKHYRKHRFCDDTGEVKQIFLYNVNANEAMKDVTRSMTMNYGTNFSLDIKLQNGKIVNVHHDVQKLWFEQNAC